MATQVVMPQLGESVVEGTVGKWLKKVGDTIKELEPLLEVESDKVNTEIPSPAGGTVLALYIEEGTTVKAGTVLAMIGQAGEVVGDAPAPAAAHSHAAASHEDSMPLPMAAPVSVPGLPAAGKSGNGGQRLSPVVANMVAQHRLDVTKIQGTGQGGRVTRKDVEAFLASGGTAAAPAKTTPSQADLPPWEQPGSGDLFKPTDGLYQKGAPAATPSPAPADHTHKAPPAPGKPGELVQLSTMRKRIAEHMVLSKLKTAPHVTTVFEADMSAVASHREANKQEYAGRGINLTFTAYFVMATARALRAHPMVNSQWTDEGVLLKPEVNIGMAVAIEDGLIVPVIKQADELSLAGLARTINDLAARARSGALKPDDVQGGTFTVTNHGVSGSLFATPIINQPQTGILGVGAMQKRVVVLDGDMIAIRTMVYITLTFDHRILDGATADFFVAEIKRQLENWQE